MIAKSYELKDFKMYMIRAGTNHYYIVYINGERSQIINHKMDVETASELFDYLLDKESQKEDTHEVFTKDEFEQLLQDLEKESK